MDYSELKKRNRHRTRHDMTDAYDQHILAEKKKLTRRKKVSTKNREKFPPTALSKLSKLSRKLCIFFIDVTHTYTHTLKGTYL